jgi:hypothetical protein
MRSDFKRGLVARIYAAHDAADCDSYRRALGNLKAIEGDTMQEPPEGFAVTSRRLAFRSALPLSSGLLAIGVCAAICEVIL